MKTSKIITIVLFVLAYFPCSGQEDINSNYLEGKWKIVGWIYENGVGRSLEQDEKNALSLVLSNVVIDFGVDRIFRTNRPEIFVSNNVYYELTELYRLFFYDNIPRDAGYLLMRNKKCYFINHGVVFEIEKTETYPNSQIALHENTPPESNFQHLTKSKEVSLGETYTLYELDSLPKLKTIADYECDSYCFENIFHEQLLLYIDYSSLEHNDVMYLIDFILDKEGGFNSFDIKEMHYYWDEKGEGVMNKIEKNAGVLTEMKKDIIASIFTFNNMFHPALKDGIPVNSQINLKLRLISEKGHKTQFN